MALSVSKDDLLLGVSLTSESSNQNQNLDVTLGLVHVGSANTSAEQLRSVMCSQLSTLPVSFTFLTKMSWPVAKSQESSIQVQQLINSENRIRIQKSYEKPRVGVRTTDGQAVGFVFVELATTVSSLREAILQQLGSILGYEGQPFQFVDRNGWPIGTSQESCLSVLDLLHESCIHICPCVFRPSLLQAVDSVDSSSSDSHSVAGSFTKIKNKLHQSQLTFCSGKDQERQTSLEPMDSATHNAKQILLSYVRAEAAVNALALKAELERCGFSTYLDVHEIKSGHDWQDSLNFAVSNCEVFIPLVTPRYGETLWTNREVKLADVLGKLIIPVCFLPCNNWPPKCLAIQFATTQYIPWKPPDAVVNGEGKFEDWKGADIELVVSKIAEMLDVHEQEMSQSGQSQLMKCPSMLRSCSFALPSKFAQLSQSREGCPLVVISVHPKQGLLGRSLKILLEAQNYEVWCSNEHLVWDSEEEVCKQAESQELFNSSQDSIKNGEDETLMPFLSQLSYSSDDDDESAHHRRLQFQEKANEAGVVVFVLSKAFAQSKTSQQHVFYCEHRKRVIPLRCEDFCMPFWLSMLIGTGMMEDTRSEGYEQLLIGQIQRALDPVHKTIASGSDMNDKITKEVTALRQKLPKAIYVYISGGTRFYGKQSEEICRFIGQQLAQTEDILVITGGFYGIGETVGRTCAELKQDRVWHVLPSRDDQDRSRQSRQNKDKTFSNVPYGTTVFSGESVRERETIVARVCDICILVEGGPGAAHEAEEFTWNDHIVVPVTCTGGAAGGKFNVPDKIFKVPAGVKNEDWEVLKDEQATPAAIGNSVGHIITSLKARLKMDSPSYLGSKPPPLQPSSSPCPTKSVSFSPRKSPRKRYSLATDKTFIFKRPKDEA